jgi:hypothetical protein
VQDDAARQKALPLVARVHTTSYIGAPIHVPHRLVLLLLSMLIAQPRAGLVLAPAFNLFAGEVGCIPFRKMCLKLLKNGVSDPVKILRTASAHVPDETLDSRSWRPIEAVMETPWAHKVRFHKYFSGVALCLHTNSHTCCS